MIYQIYLFVLYQTQQNTNYCEMETNFIEIDFVSKTRSFQCRYYCRAKSAASFRGKLVECFKTKVMALACKIFCTGTILREINVVLHSSYL